MYLPGLNKTCLLACLLKKKIFFFPLKKVFTNYLLQKVLAFQKKEKLEIFRLPPMSLLPQKVKIKKK